MDPGKKIDCSASGDEGGGASDKEEAQEVAEVDLKSFTKVIMAAERRKMMVVLELSPLELMALHGMLVLAMKHPRVRKDLKGAYRIAQVIRARIKLRMITLGFTPEQVEELDRREVEV